MASPAVWGVMFMQAGTPPLAFETASYLGAPAVPTSPSRGRTACRPGRRRPASSPRRRTAKWRRASAPPPRPHRRAVVGDLLEHHRLRSVLADHRHALALVGDGLAEQFGVERAQLLSVR